VGQFEKLPRQGWLGRAACAQLQRRERLPWAEAGQRRHESKTDSESKLYPKNSSQPTKLCYMGRAMIENRHGLVVQADATRATGKAEREAAPATIDWHDPGSERRNTVAADKAYDTSDFVADLRQKCVTPHVAQKPVGSALDSRTTRLAGYAVSFRRRKLVKEALGCGKTAVSRSTRCCGGTGAREHPDRLAV
jgi:hypothetical protein